MDRSPVALRFLPAIYRDQIYLYWLRITAIAFVALIVGSYIVGRLVPDLATDV
jgi:hypothetical protein